jgi:PIN domain nuclease of toxin-antitoxin system
MEAVVYLDTHAVVWLYSGLTEKFSARGVAAIESRDVLVSPIVLLELQYLHETGRVHQRPEAVISALEDAVGLRVCELSFHKVVLESVSLTWTRDPFDRIIAAQAGLRKSQLLTKDRTILSHCKYAFWD